MSFNQSRSDKNTDSQYRKFNRSSSTSYYHPRPSFSLPSRGSAPPSNRSFNKTTNVQGGQSRQNIAPPQGDQNVLNGVHIHHRGVHGASDASAGGGIAKQIESSSTPRSARGVPKAPTSQSATVSADNVAPVTPSKPPTDSSKPFPFQFGSISPGFMNGMQIPRTSSAPPNLDEQKRDQAHNDALKPAPHVPAPVPKQQVPRKDMNGSEQPNTAEDHPAPKTKKDSQVSPAPQMKHTQKPSVLPHPMTSMPMSYHQPQVATQFGGPNPQIQPQGVSAASLQMPVPMPLQMGNAPQVQQPVFIQGLQHHPMQPPGMMHQGQGLGFATQMGPQLPHQLGNIGIGMAPQYAQQGGKFGGGQRKTTVKITDPKTHEELRLDKRTDTFGDGGLSSLRSHPNMPPQSQPFASHPMNYYANSYGAANLFLSAGSSVPLPSGQMAPNPRFSYPVSQGVQNVSFMNSSTNSPLPGSKTGSGMHNVTEPQSSELVHDVNTSLSSASSGNVQITVNPATSTSADKNLDQPSSNVTPAQSGTVQVTVRPPDSTSERVVDLPSMTSRSSIVDKNKYLRPSGESSSSDYHKVLATSEISVWQPKQGSDSKSLSVGGKRSEATSANALSPTSSSASPLSDELVAVSTITESRREPLSRSNSMIDNQKKTIKRGQGQPQTQPHTQIGGQSDGSVDPGSVESKRTAPSGTRDDNLKEPSIVSVSSISPPFSDFGAAKVGNDVDNSARVSPEITGSVTNVDTVDTGPQEHHSSPKAEKHKENEVTECSKENDDSSKISSASTAVEPLDLAKKNEEDSTLITTAYGNEVSTPETTQEQPDEPVICQIEDEKSNTIDVPKDVETSDGDDTLSLDATLSRGAAVAEDTKAGSKDQQFASTVPTHDNDVSAKHDGEVEDTARDISAAVAAPSSKQVELARSNSKTKRKKILQKADAQGTTSDLYVAYKGPEEKKTIVSSVVAESNSTASSNVKQAPDEEVEPSASQKGVTNKTEPDDWEDAADVSTPKLEASDNGDRAHGDLSDLDKDGNSNAANKYSRDFLLKFLEQFTDLPENFVNVPDIAEALMSINISHLVDHDSYPSPGRVIDRSSSGSRMDRRGSGIVEDDRWNKLPSSFVPGRDMRVDIGYGAAAGFRPGQAGNFGVLRNPRAQGPVQYAGGILAGPMQPMGPQGGMQRNSSDAERWQRANNFQQKGLIPSPQTPLQVMHKAEKKYEVGKVTDEEEAKQRQLKAILNKLTPQNFEKLFEQVKAVNIDHITLTGVIAQIFDKALMEPTFCEMYANFCFHLSAELPDIFEGNKKITFKRLLLDKCQEEFERGVREEEEANKADEEGEIKPSDEEREEKRVKARRRMLGNIRLIGELFKKKMLTERIMHDCIKRLLGEYQNPDEEDVEALCKLMSTIGEMIDHPRAKVNMHAYFDMMAKLSDNMKLSSRVRFMLKDTIDLRRNRWQQRRKVEGPKKIEEVHRDAAQERQQQSSRLTRDPGINISARRTPMDFGPRGSSILSPPNAQMGSFRGLSPQVRGGFGGAKDVRFEERQAYVARLSVPLPQRPLGDDSITLGPQGGLARGMSIRGLPSVANSPAADPNQGDPRRMAPSLNGFSSMPDRPTYGPREDLMPRYAPDRFAVPAAYDQMNSQEHNVNYVSRDPRNADRGFDRSAATSPPTQTQGPPFPQNTASEKVYSEERLRDMSMAAIKEFYSARDEKEVALCIKDLNSPGFHPLMIALWVTDSFERKDMERDLLAKLLISLASSHDSILTPAHLSKGFESVLSTLEDAVNDAPKAPEFLGRMFAKIVLENVVSLRELGRLLHEGGEEPGSLLEAGLAGDVLGSTLEMIKTEKGESALKEIRTSSNLRLEDFRPPKPMRSRILEKFI